MPEENKRVRATIGPYAGGDIDIPAADADAAIADGWAVDPYAPVDPNAETPQFDQDTYDKALLAAEKAARKLRGQDDPAEAKQPKTGRKTRAVEEEEEDRSYQSDQPAAASPGYQTRKPPGRPRKD